MALLQYCCCGFSLRCGTITSAIYVVIRRTLGLILSKMHWTKESLGSTLPMLVSVSILSIISSALILLTFATDISRTRRLILLFIFIEPVYILTFTIALSQAEYLQLPLVLYQICGATEIIIEVCALLCVASYYEECGEKIKIMNEIESYPHGKAVYHIKLNNDNSQPIINDNRKVLHGREMVISPPLSQVEITMPDGNKPPAHPPPSQKLQVHWLTDTANLPDVYAGSETVKRFESHTARPLTSSVTNPVAPPRKKRTFYPGPPR